MRLDDPVDVVADEARAVYQTLAHRLGPATRPKVS
jgi:hypothetical protein